MNSATLPPNIARLIDAKTRKELSISTEEERLARLAAREEKELQRQIAALLTRHGIVFNRSRMDRRKTDKTGWPDFTFAIKGKAIAMECKLPGKDLDLEQMKVREQMLEHPNHWSYFVVRTYAEAIGLLRNLSTA